MKLSQGGKKSEKRKKEEEEDEERRKVTQRRRLAPASPAVGNPGSSIEPGRRYVRTERERDRIGREREPTPLSERKVYRKDIREVGRQEPATRVSLPPPRRPHDVSAESSPASALSRRLCLWPAVAALGGGDGWSRGRGGGTELRLSAPSSSSSLPSRPFPPLQPPRADGAASQALRDGHAPSQTEATPTRPPLPRRRSWRAARGGGRGERARLGVVVRRVVGVVGTRSTLGRPGDVEGWKRPAAEGRGSEQFGSATRRGHFAVRPFLH